MNRADAKNWATENAIIIDYMDTYGTPISDEKMIERIKAEHAKHEGQFTTNQGVTAFVLDGTCYATPLVEEARYILMTSGLQYTRDITVPFGALGSFPGALSTADEQKLWFYNGQLRDDPASAVLAYYEEVTRIHNGYRKWVELLKKKGIYRQAEDPILYRIQALKDEKEEYNKFARQETARLLEERENKHFR